MSQGEDHKCCITFPFSISLATVDGTGISLNVQTLTVFVECQIRISEYMGCLAIGTRCVCGETGLVYIYIYIWLIKIIDLIHIYQATLAIRICKLRSG